jgi:hypothetical protein
MGAIFLGRRHRRIEIPSSVLRRSLDAQRGWISWRVRKHFRESGGKSVLFGDITSYYWRQAPSRSLQFDTQGVLLQADARVPSLGFASLTVGKKTIGVGGDRGIASLFSDLP